MTHYVVFYGGATTSEAALYQETTQIAHTTGQPTNPVEYDRSQTVRHCLDMARTMHVDQLEGDRIILAGFSGAALETDRRWLGEQLVDALAAQKAVVSTDLHPLLWANLDDRPGMLAIAGTGASILTQDRQGTLQRLGGRGHVFGDRGSAYAVAVQALRAASQGYDGIAPKTELTASLMAATASETIDALAQWSLASPKHRIAALSKTVNETAEQGDLIAQQCIEGEAQKLAAYVLAAQERCQMPEQSDVLMHGGMFRHCTRYRESFERAINEYTWLHASFPAVDGVDAVCSLAKVSADQPDTTHVTPSKKIILSPTESRAAIEKTLDRCSALEIVDTMVHADRVMPSAILGAREPLAAVIEQAATAFRQGGRLFYIGAGTSGRLGVLDASECPPTFGVSPEKVIGIIAGGDVALRNSIEGSEDDRAAGAADLEAYSPTELDLVVGIAASGTTPYVHGALALARDKGIPTALLCCNPAVSDVADHIITLETGPEVLTGSTRLKAGTATKMALNMITTGGLALSGYVYDGLMVCMQPKNSKLRQRAARIVADICGVDTDLATGLLEEADYEIPVAILMAKKQVTIEAAQKSLHEAGGILYDALLKL